MGWRIAVNARIRLTLQVTVAPGFHPLYDWCYQTMWEFSGAPKYPEDETVMEMHSTDALYSAVKNLMNAICTEDQGAQHDSAHQMIQIPKPWTIRRWPESKLANGKPFSRILKENAHLAELEWTEDELVKLKPGVERCSSQGVCRGWSVHRWRLACRPFALGDTKDRNVVSDQVYHEWPLDTVVNSPIFRMLRN
jgi:hypothetical protein